jgi:hypothetical protein
MLGAPLPAPSQVRIPARGRARAVTGLLICALSTAGSGAPPSGSSHWSPTAVVGAGQMKDPNSPYATTKEAWFLGIKACVAAAGFDVMLDLAEGSIAFHGTDAQVAQVSGLEKERARSVDPTRAVEFVPSTAQWQAMYRFKIDEGACLRDAGYPVPAAPPEQVFIDARGSWDPLGPLSDAGIHPSAADRLRCDHIPSRPAYLDW